MIVNITCLSMSLRVQNIPTPLYLHVEVGELCAPRPIHHRPPPAAAALDAAITTTADHAAYSPLFTAVSATTATTTSSLTAPSAAAESVRVVCLGLQRSRRPQIPRGGEVEGSALIASLTILATAGQAGRIGRLGIAAGGDVREVEKHHA